MKNFANIKMVCAIALCLSLLITLCSCGDTSPSSSESDSAAQTTSFEKQNETSSEATVTSDASVDKEDETPSKSSKPSSVANNNISSKPIKPSTTTSTVSTTSTTATTPTPKTPAQLILGKWRGSADIAPLLAEQGYAVEGEQLVSCDMEFVRFLQAQSVDDTFKLSDGEILVLRIKTRSTVCVAAEIELTAAVFRNEIRTVDAL